MPDRCDDADVTAYNVRIRTVLDRALRAVGWCRGGFAVFESVINQQQNSQHENRSSDLHVYYMYDT